MDFRVLGHITVVRHDGTPVPLPSVSQRRLVGFLASRANTITSVGTFGHHAGLTDGAVRTGIARLRRRLGPDSGLVTEGPGYCLRSDRIDHLHFEQAVDSALARGRDPVVRSSLEAALDLWRGDAYAEFAHEEWAAAEAARLNELRASATELLVDLLLGQGLPEVAFGHIAAVIEGHPFRDRPRGQRMRALAAMGSVTEALRSFQEYRDRLVEEVGTLPSASLVELERLIAAGELPAGDLRSLSSGARSSRARADGVPRLRSRSFGLDDLSRQVASELAAGELVTLTGVGGIGKTRLALTVALHMAPDLERIVFVDLRSVSSPEAVLPVAARALGVETADFTVIAQLLGRRRTLVVVDGCEHVLGPAAALIGEILAGAAGGRVLATSRQPLGVDGERVLRLPALSPDDAAALFVDRASRWRDTVAAGVESQQQISAICARLDGIPLAVELAAACAGHMTLHEIADQLHDRLTLFPADPSRSRQQQTLRATMDWSYGLLDRDSRSLLRAVAVFPADFDAGAAAAVWKRPLARTIAGLGLLARASLVVARPAGESTRYELLETVRLHAEEKARAAGEEERLRSAHADHFAGLLDAIPLVELLQPTRTLRSDLADHEHMLAWVDGRGDLRRLGGLAWRTAMAHRAGCWTDAAGRYLGRDDVVDALSGQERACYLAGSFENANVLGRWADQLRFAELGLDGATGPARVALLRGAASACCVLAPERVGSLVDEAIDLTDPDALDVLLELHRTRAEGLLLAGEIESASAQLRQLWTEWSAADLHHRGVRPLAGIDLLWVSILLGLDEEVTSLAEALCGLHGGLVAGRCGLAVVAARAHQRADSARELVGAAEQARAEGVPLVENDILVVAALRSIELGDAVRACRLLASLSGGARSSGSYQLYRRVRDRVRRELDPDVIAGVRSEARREGASEVYATELTSLRAEAAEETTDLVR